MKRLVEIAKEKKLPLEKIMDIYNNHTYKLYKRAYKKTGFPDIETQDEQAIKIIQRFYKIK